MSNSERFLIAFNKIANHLRLVTKAEGETSFSALVSRTSARGSAVQHYHTDLIEFNDLRNAIVHERTDSHVIAEPNEGAVKRIEFIAELVLSPPIIIPMFQKRVLPLKTSDSIAAAVKVMFDSSYSQIPIYSDRAFVALLTTNTVTRWLGGRLEEDIFSLSETTVENVLEFTEEKNNYCFLSRNATIFEALERFRGHEQEGKRLEAILVTNSGGKTEDLLSIITIWDLPRILKKLQE